MVGKGLVASVGCGLVVFISSPSNEGGGLSQKKKLKMSLDGFH